MVFGFPGSFNWLGAWGFGVTWEFDLVACWYNTSFFFGFLGALDFL